MSNSTNHQKFYGLGIAPRLLQILESLKFTTPTPIQEKAIPVAVEGKDIIGVAQTGTGKTLAFGIPMIQRIGQGGPSVQAGARGLVILPTRELAFQVEETLHTLGRSLGLRTALLIGGASMSMQKQAISKKPHIIIGTPGRINDHLEQRLLSLDTVSILVLDEADRMLDMGFLPQIKKILRHIQKNHQTMLFCATLPSEIMKVAGEYMKLPIRVEIAPPGTMADRITQEIFIVQKNAKNRLLDKILQEYSGSTLVFTRTKYTASRVSRAVRAMGHTSAEIHSNRSLGQRREALDGFKSGKYRVLVATDIAARGIVVVGIELVLNYDIPEHSEDYVHRIGRTARAGSAGHAISFAMPDQRREIRQIEQLIRKNLPISALPELPPERVSNFGHESQNRQFARPGGSRPNWRGQRKETHRQRGKHPSNPRRF
jgi:ATP-dependent RNA helicase RhlE